MSTGARWDEVYPSKSPASVSGHRPRCAQSLAWIDRCGLGPRAHGVDAGRSVQWGVSDASTALFEEEDVDRWHDRAALHVLTEAARRDACIEALRRAVRPGGLVIIATFGPNGPERCSGLSVTRHASSEIAAALGPGFERVEGADEEHTTPGGAAQAFAHERCRRSTP